MYLNKMVCDSNTCIDINNIYDSMKKKSSIKWIILNMRGLLLSVEEATTYQSVDLKSYYTFSYLKQKYMYFTLAFTMFFF